MLGTSGAWSMGRLSQRPSNPAYHIEDCRILENLVNSNILGYCVQRTNGHLCVKARQASYKVIGTKYRTRALSVMLTALQYKLQ